MFDITKLRVDGKVKLDEIDPQETVEWDGNRAEAEARTAELNQRLEELQELLYAEGKHKVLFVLQAMDAGGKDGTIRHVLDGVNPAGVRVASFKAPSKKERAHDYLWRIHAHTPGRGELVVFNRSHYEDVLIVRVMDLAPKSVWSRRYDHIANFEQMLADEGTTIIKVMLHISKEEQRERLQDRLDKPHKNWKFDSGDLIHREKWNDYLEAFEDALAKTSTSDAPWYVVPANRKWYRNLAISEILVQTLEGLNMEYPPAPADITEMVIPD
jgi:PPK2 family polyphosphate:nucleotide phosphotransferase